MENKSNAKTCTCPKNVSGCPFHGIPKKAKGCIEPGYKGGAYPEWLKTTRNRKGE